VKNQLPQEIRDFISDARVCRVATVRANGEPHVIPVCPVFDGDSTLFIDIGDGYVTARNIRAEPRASVIIDEYSDDWNQLKRVLLRCLAEPADGAERDRAWDRIRAKFPQYESIDWKPRLTLALRIQDWRAEGVGRS
jgi:nitroimidazol reductase NimA-like FMN-containing flavoprotein (pyridoxamine 5'-phosphate oxidase superfamily)